jgi:hypothetical protein
VPPKPPFIRELLIIGRTMVSFGLISRPRTARLSVLAKMLKLLARTDLRNIPGQALRAPVQRERGLPCVLA